MTRSTILLLLAAIVFVASCAPTVPPAVTPSGDDRFLVDPRIGYGGEAAAPSLAKKFDAAWRMVMSGNDSEATKRLDAIVRSAPSYLPAKLAAAAMDIRAGRYAEATKTVDSALEIDKEYTAALVYQAEIAFRENRARAAYHLYEALSKRKDAPGFAGERIAVLRTALYNDLLDAAKKASGEESIRLLRDALAFEPSAFEPRAMLAQQLLSQRRFDEARKELDPLLDSAPDRTEVQEMLAEIDAGRGRYEEAIVRYERLAKRTKEERFTRRLEEIKQEWSAANMPAYYREALQSTAVTRAQLAVLLYWNVPSIRFAQNLGAPPIATDVADVAGREEIIRAIAIGLYDVDPVTRTVAPWRTVPADRFARLLARLLAARGAPCAKGHPTDRVLGACSIELPPHADDDAIPGSEAARVLQQVAKLL